MPDPIFVVQRHHATALHFDVRLQVGDVLASWAVPKGPSLDPAVKRLARQVEDHELGYATYEGSGVGGGPGTVIVWDTGTLVNRTTHRGREVPLAVAVERGHVRVDLAGVRLRGGFALTRTSMNGDPSNWLMVKVDDAHADRGASPEVTDLTSALSGLTNEDLERA